jgi:hypothetical protein
VRLRRRYLIAAIAFGIAMAGCSSHATRPASSSATTTITHSRTITATPRSVVGLTAEQLDAHLGVGVPAGWSPVDEGNARVWVPSDWELQPPLQGSARICRSSAVGLISVGNLPFAGCDSRQPLPKQAVALIPSSPKHTGGPSLTVRGYGIYDVNTYAPAWNFYDVPQLGVRIAYNGTLGSRVLHTLAPSAAKVALAFAYEAVPNDWHAVTEDGMSLSIPHS